MLINGAIHHEKFMGVHKRPKKTMGTFVTVVYGHRTDLSFVEKFSRKMIGKILSPKMELFYSLTSSHA